MVSKGGEVIAFPEMAHGWVSRGDLKDEKVVQDSQEAMAKAITFLKSNVPTVPVVVTIIVKFKDSPKFWAYVEGHAPILSRHEALTSDMFVSICDVFHLVHT